MEFQKEVAVEKKKMNVPNAQKQEIKGNSNNIDDILKLWSDLFSHLQRVTDINESHQIHFTLDITPCSSFRFCLTK